MPRVISHAEIEAAGAGGTVFVEPDAMVTPLALDRAQALGVRLERQASPNSPSVIRQVAKLVVARLGDQRPEVIEAVVAEVVGALAQTEEVPSGREEVAPGIDFCQMCLEQERARARTRAVLTTTGRNQKGIVARVTAKIAELGGDILDISQTLVGDYFTMIIVVDTASLDVPFADFKEALEAEVRGMGLQCMMMHEDVVSSLHRI